MQQIHGMLWNWQGKADFFLLNLPVFYLEFQEN